MNKSIIIIAALVMGAISSFGQGRSMNADTLLMDKSFENAGINPTDRIDFHLSAKFYRAGDLAPEQPISLSRAKAEAVTLAKDRHSTLRKDCINIIYTVDPIYDDAGSIKEAIKGTILIKWSPKKRLWSLSYLKYQLVNIDQNAQIYQLEAD